MPETLRQQTIDAVARHDKDLNEINEHRQRWLLASSIVYVGIILIIFAWDWLDSIGSKSVWWVIVSLMLILSINWWFWTMKVIRRFIHHRHYEVDLIVNIMHDIREVKEDVKQLRQEHTDMFGNRERRE